MNVTSPLGLADLANALLRLKPEGDDWRAIASVLGMNGVSAELTTEDERPPSLADIAKEPVKPTREVQPPVTAPSPAAIEIQPLARPARTARLPKAVKRARTFPATPEILLSATPQVSPLLRPQQLRAFLQDTMGQRVPTTALDVDAVVDQLARLRLRRSLPRKWSRGFRRGVSIVFDDSAGMFPFRQDVAHLYDAVRRVVGPHLRNEHSVAGSDTSDLPQKAPHWGATIALVTDLGIGRPRDAGRSRPAQWVEIGRRLAQSGFRVVAIVPYAPHRWPAGARRWMEIVHWHPAKTASEEDPAEQTQLLARLLSLAAHVDPALLREARRRFFPASDAGLEADFLFSRFVGLSNERAVAFRDHALADLRAQLEANPEELAPAREFLQDHRKRFGADALVLFEEELVYSALRGLDADRQKVRDGIASAVRALVDRVDDRALARWAMTVLDEMPEWVRHLDVSEHLAVGAQLRLGGASRSALDDRNVWLLPEEVSVGVAREGNTLVLREPPADGDTPIEVPATNPRVVFVESTPVRFQPGQPGRIDVELPLTLRTLSGAEYRVEPRRSSGIEPGRLLGSGHGAIQCLAFDGSGTLLASASADLTITLWYVRTGKRLHVLEGHGTGVTDMAFSPTEPLLATCSTDGTRIWDAEKGLLLHSLGVRPKRDRSVAFSPDGETLAAGGQGAIHLWEVSSGRLIRKLETGGAVSCLAYASESKLASSGHGGPIRIWDPRTGASRVLSGTTKINRLAFHPAGRLIAGGSGHTISIWDVETGARQVELEGHTDTIDGIAFSRDGSLLVSKSQDGMVRLWNCATFESVATVQASTAPLLALDPDGTMIATGVADEDDAGRLIQLWRLDPLVLLREKPSPVIEYQSAKVVLLGDTGTGKSGLANVLTSKRFIPTASTHGQHVGTLESEEVPLPNGHTRIRETLLWDLAGQPNYRLLHQWHLNDVAVALVVFDALAQVDPFASVRFWCRALRAAQQRQRGSHLLKKILVATRIDTGLVGVSEDRIHALVDELGFDGYVQTSAKEGVGIDALRTLIRTAIPWNELPTTVTTPIFYRLRVFAEKMRTRTQLVQMDAFLEQFLRNDPEGEIARLATENAIRALESFGVVRRLDRNTLLLDPALLEGYASSLVMAATEEPDGLGSIVERDAHRIRLPEEMRIRDRAQEELVLRATIEGLIERDLALRLQIDGEDHLVFPSEVRRELSPSELTERVLLTVTFEGAPRNVYSTLVVALTRDGAVHDPALWRNAILFNVHTGNGYGLLMEEPAEERGRLLLFSDPGVREETRFRLEELVVAHVEREAVPGTLEIERTFVCQSCGTRSSREVVQIRRAKAASDYVCPVCESRVSIVEPNEKLRKYMGGAGSWVEWMGGERASLAIAAVEFGKSGASVIDGLRASFERHGGREIAITGQTLVGVFHDVDDALNFAIDVRADPHHLHFRTAIHRGEVEVRGSAIVGGTLDRARTIAGAIRKGSISVTASALKAARRHRDLQWKQHTVKGNTLWTLRAPARRARPARRRRGSSKRGRPR